MRHIWSVLCQKSIINQETNNLTLVELIEQVEISSAKPENLSLSVAAVQPVQHGTRPDYVTMRLELVTLWARDEETKGEKGRARVRLLSPAKSQIFEEFYEVNLIQAPRFRQRNAMMGFPMGSETGEFVFHTEYYDEENDEYCEVAKTPLVINFLVE